MAESALCRFGKRAVGALVVAAVLLQLALFSIVLKHADEMDAMLSSLGPSLSNGNCRPPIIPSNTTLIRRLAQSDNDTSSSASPKLYLCGWVFPEGIFSLRLLFPHHQYVPLTPQTGPPKSSSREDVIVTSEHVEPACDGVWKNNAAFDTWLTSGNYEGKVLYRNGESRHLWQGPTTSNVYFIGYYKDSPQSMRIRPIQMTLLEYGPKWWQKLLDHGHKPKNTRERFAIYSVSNCNVGYREDAANRLANISIVDLGGPCNGGGGGVNVEGKFRKAPTDVFRETNWEGNRDRFSMYRFCLVLENTSKDGYVTEKILNAFLAGCVPIWYGSREIFDIFNKDSFIYYDIDNPEPALARVRELESNETLYDQVMKQPILANCQATIEEYFSYTSELGGGKLIQKLHEVMGLTS